MSIKIKLDHRGLGHIELDGVDISDKVKGCSFSGKAGCGTEITLDILGEIEFEGQPEVYIKDLTGKRVALESYLK